MNRDLAAEMEMYAGVQDYLNENGTLVNTFPRLKTELATFSTNLTEMEAQVRTQTGVITGVTANKKDSFSMLGDATVSLSLRALVWASDTTNQALAAVFAINPSIFKNYTYAKKLDRAKAVCVALGDNAAALVAYNISDTEITAMDALIKTCEVANIAPTKHRNIRKTAGAAIENKREVLKGNLKTMDNLINGFYLLTESNFVQGYFNRRKINTTSIRHTGISATITDAATGKAIEHATLTIADLNKTATSNMAGLAEIIKMKAGSYHISIAADGYTTQLMDVTVPKGKTLELAVALVLA